MNVKHVAIVGAGYMGSGIAQTCAQAGYRVTLLDSQQKALDNAAQRIAWSVEKLAAKGLIGESAPDDGLG